MHYFFIRDHRNPHIRVTQPAHQEMLPFRAFIHYEHEQHRALVPRPAALTAERIIIIIITIMGTGLFNYCPVRRRKVLHFSSSAAEESNEVWMLSVVL